MCSFNWQIWYKYKYNSYKLKIGGRQQPIVKKAKYVSSSSLSYLHDIVMETFQSIWLSVACF